MNWIKTLRCALRIAWCVLCLLAQVACGGGGSDAGLPAPPPEPYDYAVPAAIGDLWTIEHAADAGMSVQSLESMMRAVQQGEYPIVDSIAVAYEGKLVLHETVRTELLVSDGWVGNTNLELHALYSGSKSIASLLTGIAIDQGIIGGTDVPFLSLFSYPAYERWDDRKADISLHDVLTMRLGLDWNEWDPPYSDPDNQMLTFYSSEVDFAKSLLDLPMAFDPGSTFAYNTVATVALGQAIENTAPLTLIDYGSANLLAPLGITEVEVLRTPTGLPDLGRGLFLTSRDFLKFGQLYLDGGRWNEQQLVSSEWVAQSIVPYTDIGWRDGVTLDWQLEGYGYQWWTGSFEYEGQRYPSFAAWGAGEQWLMVIPGLQLVVAINAHGFGLSAGETNQPLNLIKKFIIPAVVN